VVIARGVSRHLFFRSTADRLQPENFSTIITDISIFSGNWESPFARKWTRLTQEWHNRSLGITNPPLQYQDREGWRKLTLTIYGSEYDH
jgi:hypothetical protein